MPILKKLSQDQIDLLKKKNAEKEELSPRQKFFKLVKESDGKKQKIKKWHFKAIEHGIKIHLFNGLGEEIAVVDNCRKGKVSCRIVAHQSFVEAEFSKENINGGYKFDFID